MRADLNKVLCEHERRGSKDKFHNWRKKKKIRWNKDLEDSVTSKVSLTKLYGWERKDFAENLGALRGQIKKAVGTKWDDFYSKLSKVFPRNTTINDHIYVHLFQYIVTNTRLNVDGDVVTLLDSMRWLDGDYYNGRWIEINVSGYDFYVHPITNIICKTEPKNSYKERKKNREIERQKKAEQIYKKLGSQEFYNIKGIWYSFDIIPIPEHIKILGAFGLETKCDIRRSISASFYDRAGKKSDKNIFKEVLDYNCTYNSPEKKIGTNKKQLNKREIKKYGLK